MVGEPLPVRQAHMNAAATLPPVAARPLRAHGPTWALQITNFVIFQVGWFAAVLGAAHGSPVWGTLCLCVAVGWHITVSARPAQEARLVASLTVIGFIVESAIAAQGHVSYPSGQPVAWLAPYWMVALWAELAIALNVTMRWLKRRPGLAMLLGAIAGPASFAAGVRLGGARFVDAAPALVTLAVCWAVLMPLLMWLSDRFDGVARETEFETPPHA